MIPLNPKFKFVVGLLLVGGVGALQALVKVEPTWTWLGTLVQVLTVGELYFTVPSGAESKIRAKLAKAAAVSAIVFGILCTGAFLGSTQEACTPSQTAQVATDTTQAIDLTNAVCSLAENSPIAGPTVDVICTLAEGGEQLVSVVVGSIETIEGDGGAGMRASTTAMMRVPVRQIRFSIPTASADKFLAAHRAKR